jgi:hypothetical protein
LRLPRQRSDKVVDEVSLNSGQTAAIVIFARNGKRDMAIATYQGQVSATRSNEWRRPDPNLKDELPLLR